MDTVSENDNASSQHKPLTSILLHVAPGVFILAGIFLFSQPVFFQILGFDPRLNTLLGFVLAVLLVLIPVEMGILLFAGKKVNGKLSLRGVVGYREKSPLWQYFVLIPVFLIFAIVVMALVSPVINNFLVERVFYWYPQEYNFQNIMQNPPALAGFQGIFILLGLYVLAGCVLGPLVEELYFRGYLLPRMAGYSKSWAPILNVVLFSLYHFFSPWENPGRIIALLPLVFFVWKTRNIRFGVWTHILLNTGGAVMMFISIFAGASQ